ncbi:hypothetical protein A9264_15840 [Vibrio sp. UCD-FRSSP16_10]|uniref:hypothetical protein n=1 Tax=unclassified Vibrio TaxID=2614977 RepID=UPI0007FC5862|nr:MULTISPECIES: hypothetical protein [unclassified Vibrio]OBT12743.1 hypothetical protein A9260_15850 [Vibrio sp. UCD-FRSSP16_30]OBT18196.1 hypothetical protein A9264_15840 [Vibrio sp. UCD-FRSSP16_10]
MDNVKNLQLTPLMNIDLSEFSQNPMVAIKMNKPVSKLVDDKFSLMSQCAVGANKTLRTIDINNMTLSFVCNGIVERWCVFALCSTSEGHTVALLQLIGAQQCVSKAN